MLLPVFSHYITNLGHHIPLFSPSFKGVSHNVWCNRRRIEMVLRTLERTLSVDVIAVLRLANVISWCAGHRLPFHKLNNEGTLKNPKLAKACCIHVPRWVVWTEKILHVLFHWVYTVSRALHLPVSAFGDEPSKGENLSCRRVQKRSLPWTQYDTDRAR